MRLTCWATNFRPDPGGIAELAHHVCAQLAARGNEVTVVAPKAARQPDDITVLEGYRLTRPFRQCPYPTMRSFRKFIAVQAWKVGTRRFLYKHFHTLSPDAILASNYQAVLAAHLLPKLGIPYYLFLHGGDLMVAMQSKVKARRESLRNVIRRASWVFCNSSYTQSMVTRLCGDVTHTSAVGCGYPVERIQASRDRDAARKALGWGDEPVLLTVARLVENKGIDNSIRAMVRLRQRLPNCRYVVAGGGPWADRLKSLVNELGLPGVVDLEGYVSEERKNLLYDAADLYVMTSRQGRIGEIEGFGISFLEANAHGLAVIGSRVGGIPDAVADGENGLLVEPDAPEELANAVEMLLSDSQRREQMAVRGGQRIRDRFNWPRIVAEMEQRILESLPKSDDRGRA